MLTIENVLVVIHVKTCSQKSKNVEVSFKVYFILKSVNYPKVQAYIIMYIRQLTKRNGRKRMKPREI